jgi:hypothetical protein
MQLSVYGWDDAGRLTHPLPGRHSHIGVLTVSYPPAFRARNSDFEMVNGVPQRDSVYCLFSERMKLSRSQISFSLNVDLKAGIVPTPLAIR